MIRDASAAVNVEVTVVMRHSYLLSEPLDQRLRARNLGCPFARAGSAERGLALGDCDPDDDDPRCRTASDPRRPTTSDARLLGAVDYSVGSFGL